MRYVEDYQEGGERTRMKSLQEYFDFWLEYAKPEAPENSIFGSYLFAPTRDDTPDPKEKNTPKENELQAALRAYIVGNSKTGLTKQTGTLLWMVQNGFYQKILSPLYLSVVYRILQVNWKKIPNILGIPPSRVRYADVTGPGTLHPVGPPISGWTSAPHNLIDVGDVEPGTALIVFAASTKKNKFFGNPGELAKSLNLDDKYIQEMETIAVGPVAYDKASYLVFSKETLEAEQKKQAIARLLAGVGK